MTEFFIGLEGTNKSGLYSAPVSGPPCVRQKPTTELMDTVRCTTVEEVLALPMGIPFCVLKEVLREVALDVSHSETDAE